MRIICGHDDGYVHYSTFSKIYGVNNESRREPIIVPTPQLLTGLSKIIEVSPILASDVQSWTSLRLTTRRKQATFRSHSGNHLLLPRSAVSAAD